jgi:replicative DNA helicase
MSAEESLHDVTIRVQQLEAHILRSPEYLGRADQELKRQVTMLYLAIALLLVFQGLFTLHAAGQLPISGMILMSVTSFLAIVNCLLLIKTKTWLHRLNEAWLGSQEKVALNSLRFQRTEILTRLAHSPAEIQSAEMN